MAKLSLSYADLQKLIGPFAVTQRTESRQFLAWFLSYYYRLEDSDVDDCICDGHDDKTVDGIYVVEQSSQIHVFQSRIVKGLKTLGDTALKEFYGSLSQFRNRVSVENVLATTKNKELSSRLRELGFLPGEFVRIVARGLLARAPIAVPAHKKGVPARNGVIS